MTPRILVGVLLLGLLAVAAGTGTYAGYLGTATNGGNAIASGTVALADNDGGSAMLSLAGAFPGATDTSCIRVVSNGSLSSRVRLYGTVAGGLPAFTTLTVTRGTQAAPSFDACSGFAPDATNYIAQGAGVVYAGPLAAFPATWAAGLVDPVATSPESWANGEAHVYRFTLTLQDNAAAEGQTGTADFTWEARNE